MVRLLLAATAMSAFLAGTAAAAPDDGSTVPLRTSPSGSTNSLSPSGDGRDDSGTVPGAGGPADADSNSLSRPTGQPSPPPSQAQPQSQPQPNPGTGQDPGTI